MSLTFDVNAIISQALAPAFVLSAIGVLTISIQNRIFMMGARIRDLNAELRDGVDPKRYDNLVEQINFILKRLRRIRNALFLLYAALGLMVLTTIGLAIHEIMPMWLPDKLLVIVTFLMGLLLMFIAVLMEASALVLNLRTLGLDTAFSMKKAKKNVIEPPKG